MSSSAAMSAYPNIGSDELEQMSGIFGKFTVRFIKSCSITLFLRVYLQVDMKKQWLWIVRKMATTSQKEGTADIYCMGVLRKQLSHLYLRVGRYSWPRSR